MKLELGKTPNPSRTPFNAQIQKTSRAEYFEPVMPGGLES